MLDLWAVAQTHERGALASVAIVKKRESPQFVVLDVLADIMNGGRHSRTTVARAFRVSLPTADRWLVALCARVPGVVRKKISKTSWIEWMPPRVQP